MQGMKRLALPLEFAMLDGRLYLVCLAGDCPWYWPLDTELADSARLNIRAAIAHVERHGEPDTEVGEPAPRSHRNETKGKVCQS